MKSRLTRAAIVLSALFAFAAAGTAQTATATAAPGAQASAKKSKKRQLKVSISNFGQNAMVSRKVVFARVTAAKRGKVSVRAFSSTFDGRDQMRPLTNAKKFRFKRAGQSKVLKIRLTPAGLAAVKTCEDRRIQVRAGSKRSKVRYMTRQSTDCKPEPVDLSQADKCDFIGAVQDSMCMLPFPNDFYTLGDESTPT